MKAKAVVGYSASTLGAASLFVLSIVYAYISAMGIVFVVAIVLWVSGLAFAISELNSSKIIGAGLILVSLILGAVGGFLFFIILIATCMAGPEC
jgi:hypothetical protein